MKKLLKNKKILLIGILSVLVLAIGITYAVVAWTTKRYAINLYSTCFTINYSKGQNINGSLNLISGSDYLINSEITVSDGMAVTNVSVGIDGECTDMDGTATIELNVVNLATAFTKYGYSEGALKYVVAEYPPSTFPDPTISNLDGHTFPVVTSGTITETGIKDIYSVYLTAGQSRDYLILLFVDDDIARDDAYSGSVDATINTVVEQGNHVVTGGTPVTDFLYVLGNGSSSTLVDTLEIYRYGSPSSNGKEIEEFSLRNDSDEELIEDLYIDADEVLLTGYVGDSSSVSIPDTYVINGNTYRVKVLSYFKLGWFGLFLYDYDIEEVEFGENVKSVEYDPENGWLEGSMHNIFKAAHNLRRAVLPSTVTYLDAAFAFCYSLESVTIRSENVDYASDIFFGIPDDPSIEVLVPSNSTTYDTFDGASNSYLWGDPQSNGEVVIGTF